ncbi:transcription factor atf-2-like isoform X1 [Mytilus edulis]
MPVLMYQQGLQEFYSMLPNEFGSSPSYPAESMDIESDNSDTGPLKRKRRDDDQSSNDSSNIGIPTCIVTPTSNGKSDDEDDEARFIPSRKRREFIPETNKDQCYWEKRRKNNEAARRSREKRRIQDVVLENRIIELSRDNLGLRNELYAIKKKFGIPLNETFQLDENEKESHSEKARLYSLNSPMAPQMPGYMNSQIPNSRCAPVMPLSSQLSVRLPPVQDSYPPKTLPYLFAPTSDQYVTNSIASTNSSINSRSEKDVSEYSPKQAAYNHPELNEEMMRKQMKMNYEHIMANKPSEYESDVRNTADKNESMFRYHDSGNSLPPQEKPSHSFSTNPTSLQMSMAAYCQSRDRSNSLTSRASGLQHESRDRSNSLTSRTSGLQHEDLSDDYSQDQPLSLTVRRRTNSFSGNDSSNSISSPGSPVSNSPPAMALPHKLRHKLPTDTKNHSPFKDYGSNYYLSGLTQLSEIALAQSNPLPLVKRPSQDDERNDTNSSGSGNNSNPRALIDPRYVERRKRNNEAARKCRENRKTLTQLREVKSSYLENENGKLREELDVLQDEMKRLRDLVEKKRGIRSDHKDGSSSQSSPESESQQGN